MREILFRGKRLDNGEWVYGAYGNHTSLDAMIIDRPYLTADNDLAALGFWAVNPDTVGQYTGLTDKNGVKIFEGDVVRANIRNGKPVDVVIYESAMFKVFGMSLITWIHPDQDLEVIGNVHDNPDLLEKD